MKRLTRAALEGIPLSININFSELNDNPYVKATRENPLYEDKDIEKTEAFVNDPGGYTPFSINVNWENALAAIEGEKK